MFFFNKKSPEEKAAEHLEKLRRTEGDRVFGGALLTPAGELSLADICVMRLAPDEQNLIVECRRKQLVIPYANLRGMTTSSEAEIARGESAISALEMNALIEGDAGQFLGPLSKTVTSRARWFLQLDYVDGAGVPSHLIFIAYSMRGPYIAGSKLYAAALFEETIADILTRFPAHQLPEPK